MKASENRKQYALKNRKCTTKLMKNKWVEAGANVCYKIERNKQNQMGFTVVEQNNGDT